MQQPNRHQRPGQVQLSRLRRHPKRPPHPTLPNQTRPRQTPPRPPPPPARPRLSPVLLGLPDLNLLSPPPLFIIWRLSDLRVGDLRPDLSWF